MSSPPSRTQSPSIEDFLATVLTTRLSKPYYSAVSSNTETSAKYQLSTAWGIK